MLLKFFKSLRQALKAALGFLPNFAFALLFLMALPDPPPRPVKPGEDWLPRTRDKRLIRAKIWIVFFEARGIAIGMTAKEIDDFTAAVETCDNTNQAYAAVNSDINREIAILADGEMSEQMRDIKRRFLFEPKVTRAELITLRLNDRPLPRKRIPRAVNQAAVTDATPLGNHLLRLFLKVLGVLPEGYLRRWYHYRVYFGVVYPEGEAVESPWQSISGPPNGGKNLPNVADTHNDQLDLDFSETDRGKEAWFCVVLVNDKGEAGRWGPLFHTIVP